MRVHIFGDSIVHGVADVELGGWANRLKCYFWEHWDTYGGVNIHSFGVDGSTAGDVLNRCTVEMQAYTPDVVIFAVGINDAARTHQGDFLSSVEIYEHIMETLIALARNSAAHVVCIGLTRVDETKTLQPDDGDWAYANDRIAQFDTCLEKTAQKLGVDYISCADCVSRERLFDGLHPDTQGHQKLFEHIRDTLLERSIVTRASRA